MTEQNKEAAILKAAEEEFLEKGYDGARTMSIASRAGVTHAMVHYYFRTKEQLFDRIIDEKFTYLSNSVLGIISDSNLPLEKRIEEGISVHFDFLMKNPLIPRFVIMEGGRISASIKEKFLSEAMKSAESFSKEINCDAKTLVLQIASINVFPFLLYPLFKGTKLIGENQEEVFENIKKENISLIKKKLGL